MRKIFLIFVSISILTLCISITSSVRLPTVGGDSDQWGSVLNEFLNVSFNETGELRNDTISTNQIINGTITDTDISDTTNLTLGDKITFVFGEIIDNLVDGFIRITGNLRIEGIANFSGTIYINNVTDVSVWMYNQTTATFNLYNSTWDESGWVLSDINTTSNIFGLLKDQDLINASELSDTINLDANLNWLGNYNFSINNTDFFVNPGLGRVGIGTALPTGRLDIEGTDTGAGARFSLNNTVSGKRWHLNSGNDGLFKISQTGVIDVITIQNETGNVGIGTTSPTQLLHVEGNTNITQNLTVLGGGRIEDKTGLVMPVGIIQFYGGGTAPKGWLLCNGTAVSRTTYADLFAVISTTFGTGDGSTTFNLPNLTGRYPIGLPGSGTLGASVGTALTNQENREVGQHTHTFTGTSSQSTSAGSSHSHGATGLTFTGNALGTHGHTFTGNALGLHGHGFTYANAGWPQVTDPQGLGQHDWSGWGTGPNWMTQAPLAGASAGTPSGTISSDSAGTPSGSIGGSTAGESSHTHTITPSGTNANAGSVTGTNAPYIQLNCIIKY